MMNTRLPFHAARKSSRDGFTLVELLVVIGIIAILAGVALGPITRGIKQAQESTSMQTCRQVGLMEFAYSNDNSQTYPYSAGTSEVIANLLLNGNYATDPNAFYIASTPNSVKPTTSTAGVYSQTTAFCAYDFMVNSGATTPAGLTSTASDGTPMVELTGAAYTMATTTTTGISAVITSAKAAFGNDGIAVCYKSNSAVFLRASATTAATATTIQPIVTSSYSDPSAGGYTLVKP